MFPPDPLTNCPPPPKKNFGACISTELPLIVEAPLELKIMLLLVELIFESETSNPPIDAETNLAYP